MQDAIERIIQQHGKFQADASNTYTQLDDIRKYVAPGLPLFLGERTPGDKDYPREDDTAVHASRTLGNSLHMAVTNPSLDWFSLGYVQDENESDAAKQRFRQDTEFKIRNALVHSNFQREVQKWWYIYPSAGTAILYLEEFEDRLRFEAFSPNKVSFWESRDGRVDALAREYKMTARSLVQRWPQAANVDKVRSALDGNRWTDEFTVLHFVGKDDDVQVRHAGLTYASLVILLDDKIALNAEGGAFPGYEEFPYYVGRFYQVDGEVFGRSPAWDSLEDVKVLSRVQHLYDKAIPFAINPVLKSKTGNIQGKSQKGNELVPGEIVNCKDPDQLQPLVIPTNFGMAELDVEKRRQAIRNQFWTDQLEIYPEKKYMTASEVERRASQVNQILAPQVAGVIEDVLDPMFERIYGILKRRGEIETPLQEVV